MELDILRKELRKLGKARIPYLIEETQKDKDLLGQIVELSFTDEKYVCWRAAWFMAHYANEYPDNVLPYLRQVCENLPEMRHQTQVGCYLRMILQMKVDFEDLGDLFDFCVKQLGNDAFPMYIKSYSLQILQAVAKQYPELVPEILEVIEQHKDHYDSKYLIGQANKAIKNLQKLMN
jgi:hypothetical protein